MNLPGKRQEQSSLYTAHKRRKQITDYDAPDKRSKDADYSGNCVAENRNVFKRKIEEESSGDDTERRNTPI